MAIGAATLDTNSGNYCRLRYTTAAAALADADALTFGLFGDGAATIAAPAGWAGNGTGVAGATGQTEALTDAQRTARTRAWVNWLTDPSVAMGNPGGAWVITKAGGPWQITCTYQGVVPAAMTQLELWFDYTHSIIQ